jgi:hypothetical protein
MKRSGLFACAAAALAVAWPALGQDFDPALFKQSVENVPNEVIKLGQALTEQKDAIVVYNTLLKINTACFARDPATGKRNPRANPAAFLEVMTNATPELLATAAALLAESNGVPVAADDRRTLAEPSPIVPLRALFAIGAGARAFLRPDGTFNAPAWRAAIQALDRPAMAKANAAFASDPPYALCQLLHVAARTLDARGQLPLAALKQALDATPAADLEGKSDKELVDAVVAKMKPK